MTAEPTRIGIAVVERDGRFLVGIRGDDGPLPGYAEFPGGKCHPGESPAECAIRECREETGLRVDVTQPLLSRQYEYPHGRVDLHFFLCTPARESDFARTHARFRWVAAPELSSLKFPPANDEVITRLVDRFAGMHQSMGIPIPKC
jgi:mutator protein MutT